MKDSFFGAGLDVRSKQDIEFLEQAVKFFGESKDSDFVKMRTFAKYAPRETLTQFLARFEIYKQVMNVAGSIVDCGLLAGQSLFTFAKLLSIFEPFNYSAKVYGFDTFSGFKKITLHDKSDIPYEKKVKGSGKYDDFDNMLQAIKLFDLNRPVNHIEKVSIFKGDVKKTIPIFLKKHPEVVIRLLNLDMDLYEPTKIALESFLPHIPKGGIIIFDELNSQFYPGETRAVKELLDLNKLKLQRISFDSTMSYAII